MADQARPLTEQEVLQAQSVFWEALRYKDRALFERCIADQYVARTPGAENQTRDVLIAGLVAFPGQIRNIAGEELEVTLLGDIGILTGTQVAQFELPNGRSVTQRLALTNIFIRQAAECRMILSHTVDLSSTA